MICVHYNFVHIMMCNYDLQSMTGMEHNIQFLYCDCEPLPLTLVRAKLWPATPQYPRYAFTFNLLDWAEVLLLECHVALKEFVF